MTIQRVLTFEEAEDLFENHTQNQDKGKPLQNETRLFKREDKTHPVTGDDTYAYAIKLYKTDVVTIYEGDYYELKTGGWETQTTRRRFGHHTPARVFVDNGIQYIRSTTDDRILFEEGIVVDFRGEPINPPSESDKNQKQSIKKKIDKLVKDYVYGFKEAVENGKIGKPSGGDCWICKMDYERPYSEKDLDHYFSHLFEDYYVPTMLYNILRERNYGSPEHVYQMCINDGGRWLTTSLNWHFRKLKSRMVDHIIENFESYDDFEKHYKRQCEVA